MTIADAIRSRCRAILRDAADLDGLAQSADLDDALTPSQACRVVLRLDRIGAALQTLHDLIGDAGPPPVCAAVGPPLRPFDGFAVG
jgi:hypothetical protein